MLERLAPNFRDLGRLETADGRMLAQRRILRSSALVQKPRIFTEAITGYLPVATYIDLRTETEIDRDGMPLLPPGWSWLHRPVYDIDLGRPIAQHHLPEALRRYTKVVSCIADQARTNPVVVACSLGKDRTGFVVALLLQWLGIRRDLILSDFRLSDLYLLNARRQLPKYWHDRQNRICRADEQGCSALLELAADAPPPWYVKSLRRALLQQSSDGDTIVIR